MAGFERLIESVLAYPVRTDIRYADVERLLLRLGFEIQRNSGSHRRFHRLILERRVTVLLTEQKELPFYQVKQVADMIKKYFPELMAREGN